MEAVGEVLSREVGTTEMQKTKGKHKRVGGGCNTLGLNVRFEKAFVKREIKVIRDSLIWNQIWSDHNLGTQI